MLLIFDLDDTLIDTSGCITPIKLERALLRMTQEGLEIGDFQKGLECLLRLDQAAETASDAVEEFLEIHEAKAQFFAIGKRELDDPSLQDIVVEPLEGAQAVLLELSLEHHLALVTYGQEPYQRAKMKKAGIDTSVFSKILVSSTRNKKACYRTLIEERGFSPDQVMVCGDRIATDLRPGKELGFTTVHIRWGRGKRTVGLREAIDVDHTILRLEELKLLIAGLSKR